MRNICEYIVLVLGAKEVSIDEQQEHNVQSAHDTAIQASLLVWTVLGWIIETARIKSVCTAL